MPSFADQFETLTGRKPFPWQSALYKRFASGEPLPETCDLPTGLGKTSVIAIWLIARANKLPSAPTRLIYVVNRRTVVDQTTNEVERLRENLKKLECPYLTDLAVSTLRGQHADNREWSVDPSKPAVICGTVDMIGSRLLFEGYRLGFKSRPLHAGFLAQDALLVHDEAHLEPAFQSLIESIEQEQRREAKQKVNLPWPKLRVMALSATVRSNKEEDSKAPPFNLTDEERNPPAAIPDPSSEPIHHVWRRLTAKKELHLHEVADDKNVPDEVARLALAYKDSNSAVLIFARTVDDVDKICKKLTAKNDGVADNRVQQLTGTMRGYERDELVKANGVFARFMPEGDRPSGITLPNETVYLVCTSAGEVGVNLSADHMVCDLSTFDSMAQRLGRVNRFGDRQETRVDVVHPLLFDDKPPNPERQKTLELLHRLNGDASPSALSSLPAKARADAFAPLPKILPTSDMLFDAWSMTTIRDKMPGRPPVAPYLHGVADWEPPRTTIAWRWEVQRIINDPDSRPPTNLRDRYSPDDLLADYPLKPHELLNDTSERIYKALETIGKRGDWPVWIIGGGEEKVEVTTVQQLIAPAKKQVVERIAECTILLPPAAGGLTARGTLDGKEVSTVKRQYDVADLWFDEHDDKRRVRLLNNDPDEVNGNETERMALIRPPIDLDPNADEIDDDDAERNQKRYWHWFVRPIQADDVTPASIEPITWKHHTDDVVRWTKQIVSAIDLPPELKEAVILAAELHDLGKRRVQWQLSIGNPYPHQWYAKPGKPKGKPRWRPQTLSPYRHEFGSLLDTLDPDQEHWNRLKKLPEEMHDVVLHLIAAHHGFARPHFPVEATVDPEPPAKSPASEEVAAECIRRFARLQRRYGRWGLAYLESLLRAADWAASADPTEVKS